MKYPAFIFVLLLLASCVGTEKNGAPLPSACELLTLDQLEDILLEPVKGTIPTNANLGESSACTLNMPARSRNNRVIIYVLKNNVRKNAKKFEALVAEWQNRFMGAEPQTDSGSGYPMAFFPEQVNVNPSTFLISFKQIDLAIQGTTKENAKAMAFRAMVQYQWE